MGDQRRLPAARVEAIVALRRLRMTAAEIAELLAIPLSTVSRWLKRVGLGRRSRLAPAEPSNRYERSRPGELVHVDVKKLGRILSAGHRMLGRAGTTQHARRERGPSRGIAGWDFAHVCVDDATRLAYVELLDDERGETAVAFLGRAIEWFAARGVKLRSVMTDGCMSSGLDGRAAFCDGARWVRVTDGAKSRRLGLSESAARLAA
jgi:hypothetical protein